MLRRRPLRLAQNAAKLSSSSPLTNNIWFAFFRRTISTAFQRKYTKVPMENEISRLRIHSKILPIIQMIHAGMRLIQSLKTIIILEPFGQGTSDDLGPGYRNAKFVLANLPKLSRKTLRKSCGTKMERIRTTPGSRLRFPRSRNSPFLASRKESTRSNPCNRRKRGRKRQRLKLDITGSTRALARFHDRR